MEKYRRNIGYCSITKTVSEATERLPALATSTAKEQAEEINAIQQQSLAEFKEWEVVAVFREIVEASDAANSSFFSLSHPRRPV